MMLPKAHRLLSWSRSHWRRIAVYGFGGMAGIFIVAQLLYPSHMLVPFATIDGMSVAMQDKDDVKKQLIDTYRTHNVSVYFGSASQAYRTPTIKQLGVTVASNRQVDALDYPLWLRIIPTSIMWAHAVRDVPSPTYTHDQKTLQTYISKELGESCDVVPKNAGLTVDKNTIQVVPSAKGGTCKLDDVKQQLMTVAPRLDKKTNVRVPMHEREPGINDMAARDLKQQLDTRMKDGVALRIGTETHTVPRNQLLTWLDFSTIDNHINVTVNPERSSSYMTEQVASKVARPAGVSKVSTYDFVETARINGAQGAALDVSATLATLSTYLLKGGETAQAVTKAVAPRVEYKRSYSPTDTGLSALLQQYAESHPGSFGISLIELSGHHRRAAFQDTKQFRTASTYKLYVAYGALKRVEAGQWHWSDQINGGRNLEKCLDDMIVKSDNPCGEVLLSKIGYTTLTNELRAIGLTRTSFTGDVPLTTAADLSIFNAALESGQLLSTDSKNRLIGLMKRNMYRQGIPTGANGTVANKVGFLGGYLHDAAIIYGPSGPVVLSIMTDGSSWSAIADLTKQIEALRAQ
ncbi:MAG: serine hydrolase [Candidatus Saccharimonadales bacterium]